MRRFLLDHLELHLSFLGLLLTITIPYLLRGQVDVWQAAAVTAVATATLHGLIFWWVRRRQRRVRQRAIADIREMLQDVVLNRVASISLNVQLLERVEEQQKYIERVQAGLDDITRVMNTISDESLQDWQTRYGIMDEIK